LIRTGRPSFRVVATVLISDGSRITLGLERNAEQFTARLGGRPARTLADIAAKVPVILLDSHTQRLLEDGPGGRRRFMDWGVFHAEPAFLETWQRFRLALRQRNAALRAGQGGAAIRAWDRELVPAAEEIDRFRRRYLEALERELEVCGETLLKSAGVNLDYRRGWSRDESLAALLEAGSTRDREVGYTVQGPHRADIIVRQDSHAASDRLSAGEQKMLVAALVLSQAALYRRQTGRSCILLIDDIASELDGANRERVLDCLLRAPAQIFATAISREDLPPLSHEEVKMFKLEAGRLDKMVH
jgi:DNA replication and repair protein RecF